MKRFGKIIGFAVLVASVGAALALSLYCLLRGSLIRIGEPHAPYNSRVQEAFEQDENGYVSYPGAVMGVDVSSYQGDIDWAAAKQAGVQFAILRVGFRGYSAGSLNEDEMFAKNYEAATQVGLNVGVYFYSQAIDTVEAEEEADYVLSLLNGRALQLPVFFDWEEVADGRTGGKANAEVSGYARAFCERIRTGGYRPGIYFNQVYGYNIMELSQMKFYDFWLAEYNDRQTFAYDVQFWQYTGNGHVDGIDTKVDLDLMYAKGE